VWEAYGPWVWDACAPLGNGWLVGIDTLPRLVEFTEGRLPPPAWIRVGALSSTSVILVWEPVPMASTYEVWRFQPRQNPTRIYLGTSTSCTDMVGSGDTCYYAVRAVGGAFGELRRVITGPRPCLQIREILPKDGQIHLTSSGQWWDPAPEAFYLHPLGLHPVAAIGSGGSLALYFGQPLPPASYALLIDTLLVDAYSRFLNPDCDTLPFTIPSDTDTQCLLPLRWEIVGDTFVEITFSASLPPKADTLSYYQLFPVGQVTHLQRLSDRQLRLTLSVSPHRQPLSLTWSWDTASFCPHTIAFYPAAQTLSNWGFFPNPVRGHPRLSFWGLPPKTTVSILSPSGALCTRFRTEPDTPLPSWNLQDLAGKRIQPGLYLILIEYEDHKVWEKLYVEE
jgi:hypothetical protein